MSTDVLSLEEKIILDSEEIETIADDSEEEVKYCLNCGTPVSDKFCPHCGQSTATPSKLKMKNFGKGVLMSFGRLTPGFLNTAKGLLIHPWEVIKDHIHGKHIRYSPPITMLIQIFLYSTLLFTFVDSVLGTDLSIEESMFGYDGDNAILKMIDQSVVFATLFIGIPMCFGIYLAYYRHGARKYNFAEYLAAFIYLFCAISIYDLLLSLFTLIPGIDFDFGNLTIFIAIFFSIVILLKAFPQNKKWKTVVLLLWAGFILSFTVILIAILMTLPETLPKIISKF